MKYTQLAVFHVLADPESRNTVKLNIKTLHTWRILYGLRLHIATRYEILERSYSEESMEIQNEKGGVFLGYVRQRESG